MNLGLAGKAALVAGSSRGIGRAIAEELLDEGAKVMITGRNERSIGGALGELSAKHGDRVASFAGDLTDADTIGRAVAETEKRWGQIDIAVSNVGTGKASTATVSGESEWRASFEMNLWSAVRFAEAVVPHMESRRSGVVLFIASITGVETTAAPLPYSAAKGALVNYAANLARRLGPTGVRVNALAPGNILFPGGRWEERLRADPSIGDSIAKEVPLGRFGTTREIAGLAAFLVSDRASFITGACYLADGGESRGI